MYQYNKVTGELIQELILVLGDRFVTTDPEKLEVYKTDEESNPKYHHLPEVVVFPENTEQVAAVVKLANKYTVPITPRCAGTSLAGGAIPVHGGIVLVLERMNKIVEFNEEGMYAVVQAGVRTAEVQAKAKRHGLLYAGDPCSSDSCQIGGNMATNAGGNKAVKYGTTRDQVYALEMVTPTGEIVNVGARLQKRSTGYALEKLIVGSEGTLGIVTQATLKLRPLAPYHIDILAIFTDNEKALSLPNRILKAGVDPTSIEYMDNQAINCCGKYIKVDLPWADKDGIYVIITIEAFDEDDIDKKSEILDELCANVGAVEMLIADEERIWKARRNYGEAARDASLVYYAEDFVVPLDKIYEAVNCLPELEKKYGIATMTVAHIGDGNIHTDLMKFNIPDEEWDEKVKAFHNDLFPVIYGLGGRLSGEHGIGSKRVKDMKKYADPVELQIMISIKKALDPKGILNPGKMFDLVKQ
ncbi:putative FAD-linked oxidoreductase [Sporomusa rhizae]|uniref:FAD-binding oxidoreductase n=1 Tax=Sporomusa rhizae TaxID=357999 RepID=UPI00352AECD7